MRKLADFFKQPADVHAAEIQAKAQQEKTDAELAKLARDVWMKEPMTSELLTWAENKYKECIGIAMCNTHNIPMSQEFLVQARTLNLMINKLKTGKEQNG